MKLTKPLRARRAAILDEMARRCGEGRQGWRGGGPREGTVGFGENTVKSGGATETVNRSSHNASSLASYKTSESYRTSPKTTVGVGVASTDTTRPAR